MHEFELHGRSLVANPFRDAALIGEFTAPSGNTTTVEGFYDGDDTWGLRAPDEEGRALPAAAAKGWRWPRMGV
jgi:hypothetical protein